MNPEQREQLRLSLLRMLGANPTAFGVPVTFLKAMATAEGRPSLTHPDVMAELQYLHDAGLIAPVCKQISPENVSYRIAKEGRDFLAERGLA
jgi:hypothetical protein